MTYPMMQTSLGLHCSKLITNNHKYRAMKKSMTKCYGVFVIIDFSGRKDRLLLMLNHLLLEEMF